MTYAQTTPPTAEPLTLVEVKAHLRLDGGEEDALLLSLITTARASGARDGALPDGAVLAALPRRLAG